MFCKLEVTNVDQGTEYYALSYMWGSPWGAENDKYQGDGEVQETSIIYNGHPLSVRPNLKAEMLRIRDKLDWVERRLWVTQSVSSRKFRRTV